MDFKLLNDMMDENSYKVIGIFTENGNDYVVYEDSNNDVLASKYLFSGKKLILLPIDDDKEWDLVDKYLEKLV